MNITHPGTTPSRPATTPTAAACGWWPRARWSTGNFLRSIAPWDRPSARIPSARSASRPTHAGGHFSCLVHRCQHGTMSYTVNGVADEGDPLHLRDGGGVAPRAQRAPHPTPGPVLRRRRRHQAGWGDITHRAYPVRDLVPPPERLDQRAVAGDVNGARRRRAIHRDLQTTDPFNAVPFNPNSVARTTVAAGPSPLPMPTAAPSPTP